MLGGPGTLGLVVLAAGIVSAGLTILAAGSARELQDDGIAEIDRAADLDGSLRSAHWFAVNGPAGPATAPNAAWIARHLEEAAGRAAHVDWTRVYRRPSARLPWVLTFVCVVATLGLSVRPLPRLLKRPLQASEITPASPPPGNPATPSAFVPQIIEGMRAMSSGRTPSEEQLTAIGRALEATKSDPAARKRMETEVSASNAPAGTARPWSGGDLDSGGWTDDYNTGFEIADLEWAYQEAMARARMDALSRAEPGTGAVSPEGSANASADARPGDPAGAGALTGAPVAADTRGQAVSFSSLLLGRQQATGDAASPNQAQDLERAAGRSAALRNEVVHARSDVPARNVDAPALRRATRAGQGPVDRPGTADPVRYDRSRATQPAPVPEARRPLVHDFFLRRADPVPVAKQR